jgi:ankyrin repeat protein
MSCSFVNLSAWACLMHSRAAQLLLQHGSNVAKANNEGRTALHFAAACDHSMCTGREAVVTLLLSEFHCPRIEP